MRLKFQNCFLLYYILIFDLKKNKFFSRADTYLLRDIKHFRIFDFFQKWRLFKPLRHFWERKSVMGSVLCPIVSLPQEVKWVYCSPAQSDLLSEFTILGIIYLKLSEFSDWLEKYLCHSLHVFPTFCVGQF